VEYANYCLILASTMTDDEPGIVLRQMAAEAVPSRGRRDRPWRLHALGNDLKLLVIRPAPSPAGFYNAETFNLSTELIAVHKDCYTALNLTQQGGPRRREAVAAAA
jgi:hypothetical protein